MFLPGALLYHASTCRSRWAASARHERRRRPWKRRGRERGTPALRGGPRHAPLDGRRRRAGRSWRLRAA